MNNIIIVHRDVLFFSSHARVTRALPLVCTEERERECIVVRLCTKKWQLFVFSGAKEIFPMYYFFPSSLFVLRCVYFGGNIREFPAKNNCGCPCLGRLASIYLFLHFHCVRTHIRSLPNTGVDGRKERETTLCRSLGFHLQIPPPARWRSLRRSPSRSPLSSSFRRSALCRHCRRQRNWMRRIRRSGGGGKSTGSRWRL